MIYPSIDRLTAKIGSKYLLVNVTAARVHEMIKHDHYQMEEKEYKSEKAIGRTLEEMANGMITIKKDK